MQSAISKSARILIVEDEMLVAMLLEDLLVELGHTVVGPASTLEKAQAIARNEDFDVAILDVNLNGNETYPVADILKQRSIPFIFATGYGAFGLPEHYQAVPVLQKPFEPKELESEIKKLLADRPQ